MIKAVIFDCFGVLAHDGWIPYRAKYFGDNKDLFDSVSSLQKQVDVGVVSFNDFTEEVSRLSGVPVDKTKEMLQDNYANDELIDLIRQEIKSIYKVGMLSNAGANWLGRIFKPADIELFDEIVLSFQTGFVKPDPRAYQAILEKLGLEPYECVFVDDVELYVTAARELGMKAVWYKEFIQAKEEISKILSTDS